MAKSAELKTKNFDYEKYKNILICFLSLFLIGCDGIGGVTLTDGKGNKYTFKNQSLTCRQNVYGSIYCEGSAIKKNIAGEKNVVEYASTLCSSRSYGYYGDFICLAAEELGKL